ncbi:MAG: hypothetical protein HY818_02470 [Acetobacterium woodii]|nr:hypothetical protein [Acetobacterium woodii]
MDTLITIETVPIKLEYVEKKPLALSSVHDVDIRIDKEINQSHFKREPIRIALQDAFVPSSNYNWENSTYTATGKIGDDGSLKLNIQMEDGDSRAIRFTQANRSINSMSNQVNYENNIELENMQLSIPMSDLTAGMAAIDNQNNEFMPPDLEMVVTQWPDVIIKYVGGPIYVPPSADPNYTPPIGFEQTTATMDGMKLDQKA